MSKRNNDLKDKSGSVTYSDPLTSFLYQLMRDELPAGRVEKLIREVVYEEPEECVFSNGWLAKYANNLAEEIKYAGTKRLSQALEGAFGEEEKSTVKKDVVNYTTSADDSGELIEVGLNNVDLAKLEEQIIEEAASGVLDDFGLYVKAEQPEKKGCDSKNQQEQEGNPDTGAEKEDALDEFGNFVIPAEEKAKELADKKDSTIDEAEVDSDKEEE